MKASLLRYYHHVSVADPETRNANEIEKNLVHGAPLLLDYMANNKKEYLYISSSQKCMKDSSHAGGGTNPPPGSQHTILQTLSENVHEIEKILISGSVTGSTAATINAKRTRMLLLVC